MRYVAQDDAALAALATSPIEREWSERAPGFISLVVLIECCRVLKRWHGATPADIRSIVGDLPDLRQRAIEHRAMVAAALSRRGSGAGDTADALIAEVASRAGCARILTFDERAARLGMTLLTEQASTRRS